MEIVHAMVRGRAVGKGLVGTSTSLAAYPTAAKREGMERDAPQVLDVW